jgi:HYPK UBA domain
MEEEDEGEVDETGVEPKDVELVMTQVRPVSSCFLLHALFTTRSSWAMPQLASRRMLRAHATKLQLAVVHLMWFDRHAFPERQLMSVHVTVAQAGVSKPKAIRALKSADGDIVSAIMELTM